MKPLKLSGRKVVINCRVITWQVYVDGKYVGDVGETSEALARCAAISKFDIPIEKEFSVFCAE